jgi:hypothetical protein
MSKTFTQSTAFFFAVVVTMLTCAGVNTLAASERAQAETAVAAAAAQLPMLAAQTVVVVGHRA